MTLLRCYCRPQFNGLDGITALPNAGFHPRPIRVQIQRLERPRFGPTGTHRIASYGLNAACVRRKPRAIQRFQPAEAPGGAAAPPPRKLHDLAYGLERLGLIPLRAPVVSAIILALLCVIRRVRHRADQGRRFAEPAVSLRHQGVPPIRRGDQALPLQRIRRAGGGRRQEPDGAGVRSRSSAISSPICNLSTACAA